MCLMMAQTYRIDYIPSNEKQTDRTDKQNTHAIDKDIGNQQDR